MNDTLLKLAEHIRKHRLSKRQVAQQAGVSYSALKSWLTPGVTKADPSPANLSKIESFLQKEEGKTDGVSLSLLKDSEQDNFVIPLDKKKDIQRKGSGMVIFKSHKTIRDPIHGDIVLTQLETKIIDTVAFQRLRHIKQLGTTYLVYPGANHTRFEHSLGTLAMAQKMIDSIINNESDLDNSLQHFNTPKSINLARVCSLLHDITHLPFGHSLEDEGHIYSRHDKVESEKATRLEFFLGPSSEIGKVIKENVDEEFRQDVFNILKAKGENIKELKFPFIADLVGNTICADLLDYLERDIYFTGLREAFDLRFLKYLAISHDKEHERRLIISFFRDGRYRRDVASEVIHLLRLRYSLGEKVYFHHAKVATSAMLIEALQAAKDRMPLEFREENLYSLGDDELIYKLETCGDLIAHKLVQKLKSRSLYRPVYMLTYSVPAPEDNTSVKKEEIRKRFEHPEDRFALARSLEKWNRLPDGSVIIYCPSEDMNLKEVEALVSWRDEKVYLLKEAPSGDLGEQVRQIDNAHRALWKMYVFLERDIEDESKKRLELSDHCFYEFGLLNAMADPSQRGTEPLEKYINVWAENRPELGVQAVEVKRLVEISKRYQSGTQISGPPSDIELEKALQDLRVKS